MLVIRTFSVTTVIESCSAHNLKAAGYICWSICSPWFKKCLARVQCHQVRLFTVFTFMKLQAKGTRTILAAAVLNNQKHLHKHQTAGYYLLFCLFIQEMSDYSSSPLLCVTASFPTFFVGKVAFQVLCVRAFSFNTYMYQFVFVLFFFHVCLSKCNSGYIFYTHQPISHSLWIFDM